MDFRDSFSGNHMNDTPGRNDPCWCGSGKKYKKCHLRSDKKGNTDPMTGRRTVYPGEVIPGTSIPSEIPRPAYAATGQPTATRRSCKKDSQDEIDRIRRASQTARKVLDTVLCAVEPGVTTEALDALAVAKCIELGAYPSPLNYRGYPKAICTSINEVVCHGIPDNRPLQDGDIVNCDVTVYFDGMHGDCSETVLVGEVDEAGRKLVRVTYECLMKGIEAVEPGAPFQVIGKAIEEHAKAHNFSVVRDFTGHGIGEQFHMDPQVVHYSRIRDRHPIEEGMTFTIEPMINEGTWSTSLWDDQWTAVTTDLKRSAQFEHTILVQADGVEILTRGEERPWFMRA